MSKEKKIINEVTSQKYKYGFVSKLASDTIEKGLDIDVIKTISSKKMSRAGCLKKD